jgi:RNA polymerase sigma factor (sigma-70 family)
MPTSATSAGESPKPQNYFATTHWTVVVAATHTQTTGARAALDELCQLYWYPLYAYVRRRGSSPEDAEDLTQEFFRTLLEKKYLKAADREKGRFRTFLLVALQRFLANQWDRARALKRGGKSEHVCLDTSFAESQYQVEAAREASPERIYDRRWAFALLGRTMARLRDEFVASGKQDEFEQIKECLTADRGSLDYSALAVRTGLSEGTLRVGIHRLRKRFREIFRQEVAQTVATPTEIDAEMRHLMAALAD